MFTVDKPIYFYGIGALAGKGKSEASVTLSKNSVPICSKTFNFEGNCDDKIEQLLFDTRVPIDRNQQYKIAISQKGGSSCRGDGNSLLGVDNLILDGKQEIKQNDVTFCFHTASSCNNGTNISSGQIPAIYYSM